MIFKRTDLRTCLVLVAWTVFWAEGCAPPREHFDFNTEVAFAYDSYSWLRSPLDQAAFDLPSAQLLYSKLNKTLAGKGLREVESGGDLQVACYLGGNGPLPGPSLPYAYWPMQWARGGYGQPADTYDFPSGTLIIDLVDTRKGELVWRASSRKALRGKDARLVENLDEAVNTLFGHFPPSGLGDEAPD